MSPYILTEQCYVQCLDTCDKTLWSNSDRFRDLHISLVEAGLFFLMMSALVFTPLTDFWNSNLCILHIKSIMSLMILFSWVMLHYSQVHCSENENSESYVFPCVSSIPFKRKAGLVPDLPFNIFWCSKHLLLKWRLFH